MITQEFHAIIVAAGTGSRLGGDVPKAYAPLAGMPMLCRTLNVFTAMPHCASITVVVHADYEAIARDVCKNFMLVNFVIGGVTRQDSVKLGLESLAALPDDAIILVHDAARPFVTAHLIDECVNAAVVHGAATAALPVVDTLRRCYIVGDKDTIDRTDVYAMQTPQVFRAGILRMAHKQDMIATDDTELVGELGHFVQIVHGSRMNFKITTKDDMDFANSVLSPQKRIKTGIGYDVHAFDDVRNDEGATLIRLGGIDVPFDKKLKGHSDADVVLHTITDAIYGAISCGDIGFHFPPSNDAHKNQDSADFLKHAVELARAEQAVINHIDCVIICEAPKITPHRDAIRARIADICGLDIRDVAVKATTTEGLGFTGRCEGIACNAIVTVEVTRREVLK